MAPPSLLELLREKTKTLHNELDGHPYIKALLSADLGHGEATAFINGQHGFILGAYEALSAHEELLKQHGYELGKRMRAARAVIDESVPPCPIELCEDDVAARCAGLIYVVEGSMWGSSFMAKALSRQGVDARPYSHPKKDMQAWWNETVQFLQGFAVPTEEAQQAATAAAALGFERARHAMIPPSSSERH